ncbi:OmpA family protein [Lentzea flaviverrucosa]|uniref:OmpA family protein n=1 Tax=Lentzea flaviverrucosa TaxID=200379 RepID=A0A1H9CC83_9PSEU|nr:OmpA family protein [Lentzea flaviverrucosa]RDI24508.1 OmpA family protein [Lentzea flaviverrucosa]SEP98786.1 OmpA family protein [Lentzea flaviverrucosa]
MTNHHTNRVLAGLLAFTTAAVLTACSQNNGSTPVGGETTGTAGSCPASSGKALTLVVGARMGSQRPSLPNEVKSLVQTTAEQGGRVQVVRVDGQPTVALSADVKVDAQNDARKQKKVAEAVEKVASVVTQLEPKKAEADVLGALAEASRVTPSGGTIVLIDSGLSTAGALSYQDNRMFSVVPADMAAYLKNGNLLPDLTGKSVVLVGLGGTAEPQAPLDENLRGKVAELWRTVVTAAGAGCTADVQVASRRDAFETTVPVTPVKLPEPPPPFKECGTTVLSDSGAVGFVPDQAEFRDPAAAERTVRDLATPVAGGNEKFTLIGNTATVGPEAGLKELSKRRAEKVKELLVRLGITADRVTTRGDGASGPHHVQDLGPGGVLLPGPAAQNRSVVVELSCSAR